MFRRLALTGMSGVLSHALGNGGRGEPDPKETRIAQLIAMSFGVLWAVTIGLTVLNGP